ncbi:MAG TPA: hypothetical protein VH352_15590, partial [Pseudonocardiaceae bacterium]|nr:hypothetical protein [Pseudonocardiaceae bacterium]
MSTTVSAVRRPAESARGPHRLALWYSVFTVHAGAVALLSGPGNDRTWGIWAVVGYAVAFGIAARWRTRGADVALVVGAAGGLLAPVIWLASKVSATPDVQVVERAATMLLHHGTPYLPVAALSAGGWLAYNPY